MEKITGEIFVLIEMEASSSLASFFFLFLIFCFFFFDIYTGVI